jgi:hypothetical protein
MQPLVPKVSNRVSINAMEFSHFTLNRFQCVMNFEAFQAKVNSRGVLSRQLRTASSVGVR